MIHVSLPAPYNVPGIGLYTSNRLIDPETKYITKDKIIKVVTEHFGFSFAQLDVKSRKMEIRWPRQLIMYFLCKYTKMSLKFIGEHFHRDHTTVIAAVQAVRDLMDTEEKVVMEIKYLTEKLHQ